MLGEETLLLSALREAQMRARGATFQWMDDKVKLFARNCVRLFLTVRDRVMGDCIRLWGTYCDIIGEERNFSPVGPASLPCKQGVPV